MKRVVFLLVLITIKLLNINAQTEIVAEKEKLSTILVGTGFDKVSYTSSEEGFYSPEGPMVDKDGRLLFYPSTTREKLRSFYNGRWEALPLFKFLEITTGHQILFSSQQGMVMVRETIYVLEPGYGEFYFSADMGRSIPITYDYNNYIMPYGGYIESRHPIFAYSTEVLPDRTLKVRDLEETRAWLPTQPGGFTIGDDGLLYRNGTLWSAVLPKEYNPYAVKYVGRLMSGHTIWAGGGISNMERFFSIANAAGQWELIVELPWAMQTSPRKYGYNPFNYGIGPWGELYALIAPYSDEMSPWPPKDSGPAELVVVRNHLKYFGRLNDSGVRLRKEPNTTSDIVGTYPNKTGFRILETGTKQETIGGQTAPWYKVRLLDGTEGWFFGAFVHSLYDGPDGNPPPWPNVADW